MSVVLTKTPHQKITQTGISSQWEGKHIRFTDEKYDRLHICHPSKPNHPNDDRLFVRKCHISQNRCASKNELLCALNEYLNSFKPYPNYVDHIHVTKIDITTDHDNWLRKCLTRNEPTHNKRIILLMKEFQINRPKNRIWYKVVIEDSNYDENQASNRRGRYILRSITIGPINGDYKPLIPSYDMDYRVDHSSITTTYDFWSELNNILS